MKNTTAITLILISVGLFYTFTNPQYQKVKSLRSEASQYKQVLNDAEDLAETKDELMVKYKAMPQEEIDRLKKILPDHIDTVKLAIDLDSIASRYGISIKNIEVSKKSDQSATIAEPQAGGSSYERITVSFSFISNYENFRKFIEDVERSLRLTDVRAINFQSTESGLYEYTIDIETYWLK